MSSAILRFAVYLVAAVSTLIVSGCNDQQPAVDLGIQGEAFYFQPIGQGQSGLLSDTVEVALRTPEEWAAYRDSLNPVAPFDSVDFSQSIVLLVALPQMASGYAVEFTSVLVTDSVAVAEYLVDVPAEDCLMAFAETLPFQVVLVRRTELPFKFVRSEEEYRCTFGPRR